MATMKRNTIFAIAGGVAAVLIVAVGLYYYLARPTPGGVAPLPANARMFNNWALIGCGQAANDGRCVLLRRAVNQQTQRLIMQMTIARAQNGAALMAITLPPNVVIPNGLTITPMGGMAVRAPIRTCRPQACTAAVAISETLANEMAANNQVALEFTAANGRAIRMNVNIQGFAQGYSAWLAAAPAPAVVASPAGDAAAPAAAAKAAPAAGPAAAPAAAAKQPAATAKAAPPPATPPTPTAAPAPPPAAK